MTRGRSMKREEVNVGRSWGTRCTRRSKREKGVGGCRERSNERRETRERTTRMRTPDGLRTHEGSPRAILRYKSKATSFRCNTRVSIGASWRAWFEQRACTLGHGRVEKRIARWRTRLKDIFGVACTRRVKRGAVTLRWSWPSISWRCCGCQRHWPRPWHCRPATRPAEVRTIWWRAYTPIVWRRNLLAASSTKYSHMSTRCWPTKKTSRYPRASPSWKHPMPRARVHQGWLSVVLWTLRSRAYANLNVERLIWKNYYNYVCIFGRSIESSDLDTLLFDRLGRFLRTHSVKVDLKGSDILGAIESAGRSFEDFSDNAVESRGKKSEYNMWWNLYLNTYVKGADALERNTEPVTITSNYVLLSLLLAEEFHYSDCTYYTC